SVCQPGYRVLLTAPRRAGDAWHVCRESNPDLPAESASGGTAGAGLPRCAPYPVPVTAADGCGSGGSAAAAVAGDHSDGNAGGAAVGGRSSSHRNGYSWPASHSHDTEEWVRSPAG